MQGRLGVTRDRVQSEVFTHVCAELGRIRHVVIIIADRLLPRRQQLERGYRYVGGPEMRDIESIVDPVLRAAEAGRLVESAKRSAFYRRGRARRAFALLGNDRNHTTERVGAIEPALRPAIVERDAHAEDAAFLDEFRRIVDLRRSDVVQRADLVVLAPADPVRKFLARFGNGRAADLDVHGRVPV